VADNHLRAVCPESQNHCVGPPDKLDAARSALYLGGLLEHPDVRVVGTDAQIGPVVIKLFDYLCKENVIPPNACAQKGKLAWDTTPPGNGWYYSHQNHFHCSFNGTSKQY